MNATRASKIFLALIFAAGIPLGLPLLIGVWMPDVFTGKRNILAEQQFPDGHAFRVVQYWNGFDFYSTELQISRPDGKTAVHTLDGDDDKTWRIPMEIDLERRVVKVTMDDGRVIREVW